MKSSLFRSGLAPRLAAAVIFGAVAFGTVALVERGPRPGANHPQADPAAAPAAARPPLSIELSIDAVRPVDSWRVLLDDEPIASSESTGGTWIAVIVAQPGRILSIDTSTTSAGATSNALRVRLSGDGVFVEHTFWCAGDCFVSLPIPAPASGAGTSPPATH